jgi:hypothetical protein
MRTSDQINDIAGAMVKVQDALKPAIKDATNPAFKSRYADLNAVWEACRAPLTKNGVFAAQDVTSDDTGVSVCTRLIHTSGQWLEFGPLYIPLGKKDAQGVGSATSYAKRYGLSAALGIVAEDDDDGNSATASQAKPVATNGHAPKQSWPAKITAKQRDDLRNEAKANQWPREKYYELLGKHGFKADDDITPDIFPTIFQCVRQGTMTPIPAALLPDDDSVPF